MPLNETDPEVMAIRTKLEDKDGELNAIDAKIRVHKKQHLQAEQALFNDHAMKNKIIGGKETLQSLLDDLSGDFSK